MEMDNVERRGGSHQTMQRDEVIGQGILALGIEAQGALTRRLQNRFGPRVAAGEQGDLMPPSNQFFR